MNINYTVSNSSGATPKQTSRYYSGVQSSSPTHQTQNQQQSQNQSSTDRQQKMQFLQPIVNYRHAQGQKKVIGIDMSQEEYFFYKPILGQKKGKDLDQSSLQQSQLGTSTLGVKTSRKNQENIVPNHNGQKENSFNPSSGITKFHMHQLNSNHLVTPKGMPSNNVIKESKINFSQSPGSPNTNGNQIKRSQIQNYSSQNQTANTTARYQQMDENNSNLFDMINFDLENESYISQLLNKNRPCALEDVTSSVNNYMNLPSARHQTIEGGRLSTGRPSIAKKEAAQDSNTNSLEPSISNLHKNHMLGFENSKQFNNNPLKDISNQIANSQIKVQTPQVTSTTSSQTKYIANGPGRYTMMPFEIAPKLKINNYLDQPFKQIAPTLMTPREQDNQQQSPFSPAAGASTSNSKYEKSQNKMVDNLKVSGFEDQNIGSQYSSKLLMQNKFYFEKKRLSDNAIQNNDDKYRMEDDVIKEIYEKKNSTKKGHNVSVTTNTSTTSNNTSKKTASITNYGQFAVNKEGSGQQQRKSQQAPTASKNSTPSHSVSQSLAPSSASKNIEIQEKVLNQVMDALKRKQKAHFSLKDTSKSLKELNKTLKNQLNDSTLLFLLRQHSRTHFISFAFIRALADDLQSPLKQTDSLQAILLNSLDYIKKNLSYFSDLLLSNSLMAQQQNNKHKQSKKDLNSNPFGVGAVATGAVTTRNQGNKENYGSGSNSNTSTKNSGSKSEKKMFIKQNIQISLAFLKKICRLSKQYQDKFKDFLYILNQIETGAQSSKVKEQIKRALHQIKQEAKQFQHSQSNQNLVNSLQTTRASLGNAPTRKSHKRRESMTIEVNEIDSEPTKPMTASNNFHLGGPFKVLQEQDQEDSTEENQVTSKTNSAIKKSNEFRICDESRKEQKSKKDQLFNQMFGDKENSQPNVIDIPGRYSLQPHPIGGLKLNDPPTPTAERSERHQKSNQDSHLQEKKQQIILNQEPIVTQPQLSIVTKKHGVRISNTHEPITVRGQRSNHHKLQVNEEQNGLQYCLAPAHINQRSSSQPSKEPYLPKEVSRGLEYTLVLDLDETLVHFDAKIRTYRPRPFAKQFIQEMSKYFELVVFTAGLKDYADWILNDFDRQGYISHRLYRDHTKYRQGVYVKDLSKLGRDLTKCLIIDNIEENFCAQPDNGIPIKGWYSDQSDRELEKFAVFLRDLVLRRVRDIRPEIRQYKMSNPPPTFQGHGGSPQPTSHWQHKRINLVQSTTKNNYQQQQSQNQVYEEEEESEDEQRVKIKVVLKKQVDSSDEEEEEDEEDEDEDEDSEDSPKKKKASPQKKPQPKKKQQDSSEEEEEESEEEESDSDNDKKKKKQKKDKKKKSPKKVETEKDKYEKLIKELKKKNDEINEKLDKKKDKCKKYKKQYKEEKEETQKIETKLKKSNQEIEDYKNTIAEKDAYIVQQQLEMSKLQSKIAKIPALKDTLQQKQEEIGILKAKICLDKLTLNLKIVAEYPDMISDNNRLYDQIDEMKAYEDELQQKIETMAQDINDRDTDQKAKQKQIKSLEKEVSQLKKTISDHRDKIKHLNETIANNDKSMESMQNQIKAKNDELEVRLENISKLIQKNEQMTQQVRLTKQRLEKFKAEQVASYQKELSDKSSEIEVLKEMVKGNQTQLRAKEKEVVTLKQKLQRVEGMQLAQKQQANMLMNNMGNLSQSTLSGSQQQRKVQLGQLKGTPQRGKGNNPLALNMKQSSGNSQAYLPPLDSKNMNSQYNDGMSQYSAQTSQSIKSASNKNINRHPSDMHSQNNRIQMKQQLQKRIDEDAEGEVDQSRQYETADHYQSQTQIKPLNQKKKSSKEQLQNIHQEVNAIERLAQDVRSVVQDENDEFDDDDQANHNQQLHNQRQQRTPQNQEGVEEEDFEQYNNGQGNHLQQNIAEQEEDEESDY